MRTPALSCQLSNEDTKMKRLYHLALAATLAIAVASPALAAATRNSPGPMGGTDPIVTRSAGESTSPGDPFFPGGLSPDAPKYEAECRFSDRVGDFVTVTFVNTGDETIPAGTMLIASRDEYGNGSTKTLPDDLKPGESFSYKINVDGSPWQYAGMPCDVWLYAGTGPLPTHPL